MHTLPSRRTVLRVLSVLALTATAARGQATRPSAADAPPAGQRVFVAGHSFHVPIAPILAQIAKSAGIKSHEAVGQQFIGGSTVTQHWNLPDSKDKARKAIKAGTVDVLTLSPHLLIPDDAIDKYTALLLEHSPTGRVTIQCSWMPKDGKLIDLSFHNVNRDQTDLVELDKIGQAYLTKLRAQATAINDRYEKTANHQVAFLVPVADAIGHLRAKVAKGEVPGVAKQAALFRDDLGHGTEVIYVLNAYCHYAVIYGRSPTGLPVPDALTKGTLSGDQAGKVNRILQEIAWDAVLAEPMSGVKK